MKTVITVLLMMFSSILYCQIPPHYEGDLTFKNEAPFSVNVTYKMLTIPYEGKTNQDVHNNNRFDLVYNGTNHKHFTGLGVPFTYTFTFNAYASGSGNHLLDFGSVYGNELNHAFP